MILTYSSCRGVFRIRATSDADGTALRIAKLRARGACLVLTLAFLGASAHALHAQQKKIDSLLSVLSMQGRDTNRVHTLVNLCYVYAGKDNAKSLQYGSEALALARALSFKRGIAKALIELGPVYGAEGEHMKAQEYLQQGLRIARELHASRLVLRALHSLCGQGIMRAKYDSALAFAMEALKIGEILRRSFGQG